MTEPLLIHLMKLGTEGIFKGDPFIKEALGKRKVQRCVHACALADVFLALSVPTLAPWKLICSESLV